MESVFTVKIHKADEGGYWAEIPELPGCFTQGETLAEVRMNARKAIALYREAIG
jgi:predicted RNase H-like HicB family nuclease